MRTGRVLIPRETRKESNGDRIAPAAFCVKPIFAPSSASAQITAPPTESEWPFRYFVVEWTTTSHPRARGLWKYGVANVLSTTTRIFVPKAREACRTPDTRADRSEISIVGFVGVSTNSIRVAGVTALRTASASVVSTYANVTPKFARTFEKKR